MTQTYLEIVEFVFVVTPSGIVKIVVLMHYPHTLVCVILRKYLAFAICSTPSVLSSTSRSTEHTKTANLAFGNGTTPVLNRYVLVSLVLLSWQHRDRSSVKVAAKVRACESENRRSEVNVCSYSILNGSGGYTWTSDEEWYADVFVKATLLARGQSVLTQMITIVRTVDDVCLVQYVSIFKLLSYLLYNLVDTLESLETSAVEVIEVRD